MSGDNGPRLEMWDVRKIKPYEKNPRSIPDKAVAKVAGSLKAFGFQKPLVIDEHGVLIAGHVVLKAALQAGFARVPVLISNLDAKAARAYRLADNRTAQETDWLDDLLKDELTALDDDGFDLSSLGFDDRELQKLMSDDEELARAEETPDAPVNPVSIEGDVWVLGNHRIICGDSTKAEVVEKLLGSVKPDTVYTDPPYGVSVVKGGMVGADFGVAKKGKYAEIAGDDTTQAAHDAIALCQAMRIRVQIYWGGNYYADKLSPSSCWLIWDKRGDSGIENTFADCEMAWTNMRGPARVHKQLWNGMIREGERGKRVHPTQKPVKLAAWALGRFSNPKSDVLDLFLGSGSTLMACEVGGYRCFGVEMAPAYVDVAVKRWEQFTGSKATLDGDGRTFEQIDEARYAKTGAPDNSAASYDAAIAELRVKHEAASAV